MTPGILLTLAALGTSTPSPVPSPATVASSRPLPAEALIGAWIRQSSPPRPRVNVSLDAESPYHQGDPARVYLMSEEDAYVTVVRIDTDGRVRLLFPIDPWEDNWVRGGKRFEVLGRDRDAAFNVTDYPGVGYVFAVASPDPFDFGGITRGDHWDYRAVADDGRVSGDPYVAISDLADRIAPGGQYDYDVAEYYVENHYDYPRFACYDCHSYTHWTAWDPYSSYCSSFRIVIYDDWYYYPYRYYPYYPGYYPYYQPYPGPGYGPYYRPYHPGPRYVFKDRGPGQDYVSRVTYRERESPVDRRSIRTGQDVGGRGSVPAPTMDRRRGQSPEASPAPGAAGPRRTMTPRTQGGVERGTPSAAPARRQRSELQPQVEPRPQGESRPPRPNPQLQETRRGGAARDATPSAPNNRAPSGGDSRWGSRPTRRSPGGLQEVRPGDRFPQGRESPGVSESRRGSAPGRATPAPSRGGGSDRGATARAPSRSSGGASSRGAQPELRRRQP